MRAMETVFGLVGSPFNVMLSGCRGLHCKPANRLFVYVRSFHFDIYVLFNALGRPMVVPYINNHQIVGATIGRPRALNQTYVSKRKNGRILNVGSRACNASPYNYILSHVRGALGMTAFLLLPD